MSGALLTAEPAVDRGRFPVLRKLFSFPLLLSALLSLLAELMVRSRFDDPDMWWHLKMGQIIWKTHRIPTTDVFSYTTHHHSWVPHEWLSQASIYGAYRADGYTGLMLWLCFFTIAVLLVGYALCSLYSGNSKVAFAGAMTIWFFATAGVAIRPQMIGYLLLTFELLILHVGRTRDSRYFFCLPPLFAIWVNCHGSFFLGLVLGVIVLLCSFFTFQLGLLVSLRWDRRTQKYLAWSLLLSVAALFLNPVGLKQIVYPLNTMLHQSLGLSQSYEWLPLQMNDARGVGMMAILAAILISIVVRRSELFLDELIVLALGTWLAVSHRRMVFVFGILAAPILCRLLSPCWDDYHPDRDRPWANAGLMAIVILIAGWAFPNRHDLATQVNQGSPEKAVQFIQNSRIAGNMLNEYAYGGYLIWAAPEHPVFIDGRSDVFEWTGVLSDYLNWESLQSDPNTLLNKYNITFCLLPRTSVMVRVLPLMQGWRQIYSDEQSAIFIRTATAAATKQKIAFPKTT